MARTARVRSARDVGAVVAEARQLRGWTQKELAERAGIERSYLARIETGASVILLDRVFRLLRRLGVEVTVTLPDPADAAPAGSDRASSSAAGDEGDAGEMS